MYGTVGGLEPPRPKVTDFEIVAFDTISIIIINLTNSIIIFIQLFIQLLGFICIFH